MWLFCLFESAFLLFVDVFGWFAMSPRPRRTPAQRSARERHRGRHRAYTIARENRTRKANRRRSIEQVAAFVALTLLVMIAGLVMVTLLP